MSSGIGAYAPRYMQTGGEASMTSGLDAAQGSTSNTLTPEQVAAINALGGMTGSAGRGAAAGYQGAVNTQALPDYLNFDGNLISIAPTATNRQFIDLLNDLGLFGDQKSDGLTDYEWFVKATQDNPNATWMSQLFNDVDRDFVVDGDFASRSGYSETNLERFRRLASLINPASQSGGVFQAPMSFVQKYKPGLDLTANRGDGQDGEDGQVERPRQVFIGQRPTGLGLDPNTGQPSAQQPYYTQSDVLVDSTEQPNLYTYNISPATGIGQFDPMNVTTSANPYATSSTDLSTSYTSPGSTSPGSTSPGSMFESDVNFANIFGNVVTPDQVRVFYRMYLGRDPGPNQYVMQFVNSGKTLDQIETEIMTSPEAQNFKITGVPVSSAEELAQIVSAREAAVTPDKVRGFYQQYLGRDPGPNEYVMQFVNSGKSLGQIEQEVMNSPEAQNFAITGTPVSSAEELAQITSARAAPANTVTPDEVRGFYQQYLGRDPGANQYVMQFVNSGMSLPEIEDAIVMSPEGQNFAITGVPVSSAEELASITNARNAAANTVTSDEVRGFYQEYLDRDPGENKYVMEFVNSGMSLPEIENAIAMSPEAQGLLNTPPVPGIVSDSTPPPVVEDTTTTSANISTPAVPVGETGLTSTQAAIKAFEERKAAQKLNAGFASGGIVDLSGDMSLEANNGQGLESFLQSRSKAALRRNLARTAPRPTAPVMQQGIMPMAR